MTTVAILPISGPQGDIYYQAVAGARQSEGRTAGEALDALTLQLPSDDAGTLVVVQHGRPDRFFNAAQQQRLAELMERWRRARDVGVPLEAADQTELNLLIEAELLATTQRAAALADASGR